MTVASPHVAFFLANKLHLNTPQRRSAPAWDEITPHQQAAVVCIRHSKRETRRPRTADIQAVVMIRTWNKAMVADHFLTTLTHHLASFQTAMSLWKYPCVGMIRWDEDEKWEEPSVFLLSTLLVLLSSRPFLFLCADLFKLNSQSERFLPPTGSAANSTCWISQKNSDTGRLEPTVRDTPQKLGRQMLTDGQPSAWCVRAFNSATAVFLWCPLLVLHESLWCYGVTLDSIQKYSWMAMFKSYYRRE